LPLTTNLMEESREEDVVTAEASPIIFINSFSISAPDFSSATSLTAETIAAIS
jgi:hypothetical protein